MKKKFKVGDTVNWSGVVQFENGDECTHLSPQKAVIMPVPANDISKFDYLIHTSDGVYFYAFEAQLSEIHN